MPTSFARPPASSSRPCQNWIGAEQYQWLLMFRHMPRQYSTLSPGAPHGVSRQRFGPSRRSKSTITQPCEKSTRVICAVSAQWPRSDGLSTIVASLMSKAMYLNERVDEGVDDTPLAESNA